MQSENRYYVYGHYTKETNEIFYIGRGTRNRATSVTNRSGKWKEVTKNSAWYSVILFSGLSLLESIEKEDFLIRMLKNKLVNTDVSTGRKINTEDICKSLYYNEDSPTCVSWLTWNRARNPTHSRNKGEVAGGLKIKNGKRVSSALMLNGMSLQITRVIWFLVNGEYPDRNFVIDHIDGNPWNNKISNLRKITYELNSKNRTMADNNTSGVMGVHKMFNGWSNYYGASVTSEGKRITKYFNIDNTGEEAAMNLAIEWRKARIAELNEQGAGYTSRHGT